MVITGTNPGPLEYEEQHCWSASFWKPKRHPVGIFRASLCIASLFSKVIYSINPSNHSLPNIKLHLLNSRRLFLGFLPYATSWKSFPRRKLKNHSAHLFLFQSLRDKCLLLLNFQYLDENGFNLSCVLFFFFLLLEMGGYPHYFILKRSKCPYHLTSTCIQLVHILMMCCQ